MGAKAKKVNLSPLTIDNVNIPEKTTTGFKTGYIQKTHSDLRADLKYQRESEKFLTWLGENQGAYEKITGGLVSSDMFETLRDEEGRLGTAVDRANIMRDAPENIKETYKYLSEEFVASKAGSFGEILKATWDRGVDMVADPINLTFAFVAPGVGNAATRASTAAAQKVISSSAGKAAANKTVRNVAAANTGKAAAFEGGAWTGIENYYRQDKNISLGIQDAFSKGDFALSTGAGVVLGGSLGYGLARTFGSTPRIDNIHDTSKTLPNLRKEFTNPESPRPDTIEYKKFTPRTGDTPATEVVESTKINWGPVLGDDGTPRTRPDGTPIFATTKTDKDGNFLSIDVNDVALRESFDRKPWTTSQVPGVKPLKENDIQSADEWVMFNLFHERNHASTGSSFQGFNKYAAKRYGTKGYKESYERARATYENGANVAALKDLKIWRKTQALNEAELPPAFAGVQAKTDATLSNAFNKVQFSVNPITGANFYNRLLNPEVDAGLLNKFTVGLKDNTNETIVSLPEADAANLILAVRDIIIQKADDGRAVLGVGDIAPDIQTAIQDFGFNPVQIKKIVDEVTDAYIAPVKLVDDASPEKELIAQGRLTPEAMLNLSNQLANDMGGSSRNTGSMLFDELGALNADGSLNSTQVKDSMASVVAAQTLNYLGSSIGGFAKAINILAPAKRFAPNVISALQRMVNSETGSSWRRGSVQVSDIYDYNTYSNQKFGTWQTAWRAAYDGIKVTAKGPQREEVDKLISNAVRKNTKIGLRDIEFSTPEAKKAVVDSIEILQKQLREIGQEGKAKGVLRNTVDNYLPRLWERDKIIANKEKFTTLVMQKNGVKGIDTREQAERWIEETLDIKYQFDNVHAGGGNSFFANRKLDIGDDTIFNEFLDTDLDRVMTSYFSSAAKAIAKKDIFGVRNLEEFNQRWIPAIEKEMKLNGASGSQILSAKNNAAYLYKNVTGEGMDRYGNLAQNTIEGYMLGNRMALLPLSTLSSITEVFINMSTAGTGTFFRGLKDASMNGSRKMYDDSVDVLTKVHGMSRAEATRELRETGRALEQAASDGIERLSGDTLSNTTMRKISNRFFKLTLLDQWTRTVQLASYTTGKRLITENIESLAAKASLLDTNQISKRMQRQMDELADLGIDYRDGIAWYDAGAKLDDAFYSKVKSGGGKYTDGVILNPSSASGLKPTFMSNPKTAVFGQLLGYPAAFTNTILKGMAKQTARNPETLFTQHIPAAAVMTGIAAFTNGVRTNGESWEDKEGFEIATDGFIRWGGNGVLADMMKRGSESAQYYQEPMAYFTGAGVVAGDAYNLVRQGDLLTWLGSKTPGRGAINAIFGPFEATEDFAEDYTDWLRAMDKRLADFVVPEKKATGGIVENVAQVIEEPDERIDRMTGLPYNIQAGGAFVDEEDRQEFATGSIVKAGVALGKGIVKEGSNIIKLWHGSPNNFNELRADKAIDSDSLSLGRGVAATEEPEAAKKYLKATPDSSIGIKATDALQERTDRGSDIPTLYEVEARIEEGEIIRTGTNFKDQPSEIQNKITTIAKDYNIKLSESDKSSKKLFYILMKKIQDEQNINLTAETIFKNYGIKAAKRDLNKTAPSLKDMSTGGNTEYSFFDDSVLDIISKETQQRGPRNLIKGSKSLIKKAKAAGMDTTRIVYHGAGEEWARPSSTFDEKYFLDNYMDAKKPWQHMAYLSTDEKISSAYAQKKWNRKAEEADVAAGNPKRKGGYWETPEIVPLFLKGKGLKLKKDNWTPSTYKVVANESPAKEALPWGKWFRQDAMKKLNIADKKIKVGENTVALSTLGEARQIKEIWKAAKEQDYGYIEMIDVEDVSGDAESALQTQLIPLGRDKVKSIYADYDLEATKEELARNLFSAQGGYIPPSRIKGHT